METAIALSAESENQEAYVRVICSVLVTIVSLSCLMKQWRSPVIRAGLVYDETCIQSPIGNLTHFVARCRSILRQRVSSRLKQKKEPPHCQHGKPQVPEGFKRFMSKLIPTPCIQVADETMGKRIRAASLLEMAGARLFLRRAKSAHAEGYAGKATYWSRTRSYESSLGTLEDAGLVGREVQISGRKKVMRGLDCRLLMRSLWSRLRRTLQRMRLGRGR